MSNKGTVAVLFIAFIAYLAGRRSSGSSPSRSFEELAPGLYRHIYDFPFLPTPFVPVPVAVFLIRLGDHEWALIDTGPSTPAWQNSFRAALQRRLGGPKEKLQVLLMTHGHGDHSDGWSWVVDTFPEVKLVAHAEEKNFTSGGRKYADLQGDHWKFGVGKNLIGPLNSTVVDAPREILLTGHTGDVASFVSSVPKGLIGFHHLPGHSPGHTAFIHWPSKSVISGDTVMHMPWTWPWKRTAALAITDPVLVATQSQGVMRESQRELAAIEGVDAFYPSHDDGLGVSPEQLSRFVAGVKKA